MTTGLLVRLAQARKRDALLYLEAYCRAQGCPAREITVYVKDPDDDFLALVRKHGGLHCPICGGVLALHWVRTAAEQDRVDKAEARRSVNGQIYARDHARDDGLVLIPLSAYHDQLAGEVQA
jgi:hypothetical protein